MAASHLQYIPDRLQILTQSPATERKVPHLPPPRLPPPPRLQDLTGCPSFLRPPGVGAQRCAGRWTVGVCETVDGEMNVRWSEVVSESGGVGQVCSAALECCSEPKTLGGGTTPMCHRFRLKGITKFSSFIFLCPTARLIG